MSSVFATTTQVRSRRSRTLAGPSSTLRASGSGSATSQDAWGTLDSTAGPLVALASAPKQIAAASEAAPAVVVCLDPGTTESEASLAAAPLDSVSAWTGLVVGQSLTETILCQEPWVRSRSGVGRDAEEWKENKDGRRDDVTRLTTTGAPQQTSVPRGDRYSLVALDDVVGDEDEEELVCPAQGFSLGLAGAVRPRACGDVDDGDVKSLATEGSAFHRIKRVQLYSGLPAPVTSNPAQSQKYLEEFDSIGTNGTNASRTNELTSSNEGTRDNGTTSSETPKVIHVWTDKYARICDRIPVHGSRAQVFSRLMKLVCRSSDFDRLSRVLKVIHNVEPWYAPLSILGEFHTAEYLETLCRIHREEPPLEALSSAGLVDDCAAFPGLLEYVSAVAGATLRAADALVSGECAIAVNFEGGRHHARASAAKGFCYVGDAQLAIMHLRGDLSQRPLYEMIKLSKRQQSIGRNAPDQRDASEFGETDESTHFASPNRKRFRRILYIDTDIHHGDGVEAAFGPDDEVCTLSVHRYGPGYFPGTGRHSAGPSPTPISTNDQFGHIRREIGSVAELDALAAQSSMRWVLNFPLPPQVPDALYIPLVCAAVRLAKKHFEPDAVVWTIGADALECDKLSSGPDGSQGLRLSVPGLVTVLSECLTILGRRMPILVLGGGGYHPGSTSRLRCLVLARLAQEAMRRAETSGHARQESWHCPLMMYTPVRSAEDLARQPHQQHGPDMALVPHTPLYNAATIHNCSQTHACEVTQDDSEDVTSFLREFGPCYTLTGPVTSNSAKVLGALDAFRFSESGPTQKQETSSTRVQTLRKTITHIADEYTGIADAVERIWLEVKGRVLGYIQGRGDGASKASAETNRHKANQYDFIEYAWPDEAEDEGEFRDE